MKMADDIITIEDSGDETDPLRLSPPPPGGASFVDGKPPIELATSNFLGNSLRPIHIPAEKYPIPPDNTNVTGIKRVPLKRAHPESKATTSNRFRTLSPITVEDDVPVATSSKDLTIFELFHQFTTTCLQKNPHEDMVKIMVKLKKAFEQAVPNYVESREFKELVESNKNKIISDPDPEEAYVYLKDVYDELRLRKLREGSSQPKKAKVQSVESGESPKSSTNRDDDEDIEDEAPVSKKVEAKKKKLEQALKKCDRRIKRLEQQEVDLDDDEDSTYIQTERYKDRFAKIYRLLASYTGERDCMNRPRVACATPLPVVNKCIEAYVNKTGQFPDYRDISSVIEKTVEKEKLNLTSTQISNLAMQEFENVGNQLQKFRQNRDWNNLSVFLDNARDPAEEDPTLSAKLAANRVKAVAKLNEVIVSYAEKQEEKKLVPEVVTEEQANKSAGEEEEGDEEDVEGENGDGDHESSDLEDDYFGDRSGTLSSLPTSDPTDVLSTLGLRKHAPSEPVLTLDVATGLFTVSRNAADTEEDVVKREEKVGVEDLIQLPSSTEEDVKPTTSTDDDVKPTTSIDDEKKPIALVVTAKKLETKAAKSADRTSVDVRQEIVIDSDDDAKPAVDHLELLADALDVHDVTIVYSDDEELNIPQTVIKKPTAPVIAVKKLFGKVLTTGKSTRLLNDLPSVSVIKKANPAITLKRVTKVTTKQESTCVRSEMLVGDGSTVVETKCKTIRVRSFGNVPFSPGSKNAAKEAKVAVVDDDDDDVIVLD